jgi:hypothetical protein
MVASANDSMPHTQLPDMKAALDAQGVVTYQSVILNGSGHAFDNWPTVKNDVLAFLAANL